MKEEKKKKKKSKNLVVLLWPGPFLTHAAAVNAPVKTNLGCHRAILLSAHTPATPIHTNTNLCSVSLPTSPPLLSLHRRPVAVSETFPMELPSILSCRLKTLEIVLLVSGHVCFESRWMQQKALECEQNERPSPLPSFRYMRSAF